MTKTVKVTVAAVKFSKATNQRYGYDNFDTPSSTSDDHVSVKKSDHSFVHVDITGGAVGTKKPSSTSRLRTTRPAAAPVTFLSISTATAHCPSTSTEVAEPSFRRSPPP